MNHIRHAWYNRPSWSTDLNHEMCEQMEKNPKLLILTLIVLTDIHHVKSRLFRNRNVKRLPSLSNYLHRQKKSSKHQLNQWHHQTCTLAHNRPILILTLIVLTDIHHVKSRLFWNRNVKRLPSLCNDLHRQKKTQNTNSINDTTWHALLLIIPPCWFSRSLF